MSNFTTHALRRTPCLFGLVLLTACGSDSAVVGPPVGVDPLYNQIVFDSDRDDLNRDVYAMNLDGSGVRRLTNSPFADFCPAVSPDGYRIAFYSSRQGDRLALYIMLADGADVRYVEGPVRSDVCPRWSASGNRVLFQRPAQGASASTTTVETATYDGSSVLRAVPEAVIPYADLSPDGANVLLARRVDNDPSLTGIFIRSPIGNEAAINYEGWGPVSWSPDGKTVAYLCSALPPPKLNGTTALCLASPDGTSARKIDTGISYIECQGLEWSPDSKTVICPGINGRIFDVEAGTATEFSVPTIGSVRWFGDNRRIAFVLPTTFEKWDVWIAASDGSGEVNLTNNSADDEHPSVGPLH